MSLIILTKWKSRFIGKNTKDCNSARFSLWMTLFFFLSNVLSGHIFKIKKLLGKNYLSEAFPDSSIPLPPPFLHQWCLYSQLSVSLVEYPFSLLSRELFSRERLISADSDCTVWDPQNLLCRHYQSLVGVLSQICQGIFEYLSCSSHSQIFARINRCRSWMAIHTNLCGLLLPPRVQSKNSWEILIDLKAGSFPNGWYWFTADFKRVKCSKNSGDYESRKLWIMSSLFFPKTFLLAYLLNPSVEGTSCLKTLYRYS